MDVAYLNESELVECWSKGDPAARMRCSDALIYARQAASSALVHFTLEPDGSVPLHTDSAEEVVLVLGGAVEVCIDKECRALNAGGLVFISALRPHSIRNVGSDSAQLLGFFAGANVVSTFDEPLMPWDMQVFTVEGGDLPNDTPAPST